MIDKKELKKNIGKELYNQLTNEQISWICETEGSIVSQKSEKRKLEILKRFEEEFVANDILDCIPEKNWEEMKGEVRNFLCSALQEFGEDLVGEEEEIEQGINAIAEPARAFRNHQKIGENKKRQEVINKVKEWGINK